MPKSESEGRVSSEEESENETAPKIRAEKLPDYENQRLKRIEENKKRMEALGLRKMATSFNGCVKKAQKMNNEKKGKRKVVDEDEEYNPTQEDEEMSSSSSEEDDDDVEISPSQKKKKKKVKRDSSTPKKRGPIKKPTFDSDFVEDDDALMQAIALSLQDSEGFVDVRSNSLLQSSGAHLSTAASSKTPATLTISTESDKRKVNLEDDSGKRKRKKPIASRVQMTEDEMLIHFFQFDETGKGGFTVRDIQRLATAHDFTWSEKEIADMIYYFDGDGDGKINLDDFRKIVGRCNMLKVSNDGVTGQ